MLKWLGLFFNKSQLLWSQSCLSLLNSIGTLILSQLSPRKLEPWFVLWSFFLQRLLCISINLPYDIVWNIFVMSGLVHRTVALSIPASLETLVHHPNAASLKVVSATFLLVCFVFLKKSTCETRKNIFHFTSKTLFVLEII